MTDSNEPALLRGGLVVDLGAIAANVAAIKEVVGDSEVCAVVKADGYGHGASVVARSAIEAGAGWLAVATPSEGIDLRRGGIAGPILLLSEAHPAVVADVVAYGLTPTLYSSAGVAAYAAALRGSARRPSVSGHGDPRGVHIKVNTGMNRVGCQPDHLVGIVREAVAAGLDFEGLCTHLAVADNPSSGVTEVQLDRFDDAATGLESAGFVPAMKHAANSAGALAHPRSHYDMVRCGIAVYGIAPSPELQGAVRLLPAMEFRSSVALTKTVGPGEGISYGHRFVTERVERVATVPLGYGDGVPRGLGAAGAVVLARGHRHTIAGVITMDQFMFIDSTPDGSVGVGDDVVLLGTQGRLSISAQDWADALGTIAYEVVTRVGPRVPRIYR